MKSKQLLSIVFSVIMFTGVTAGSMAFAESDEIELKGILSIVDDNTFELDTENGIETLSINDDTIIDNGLSLSELDGFVVDVDAVIIDDVLFATEIEFDNAVDDEADVDEDISLQGTILAVNDDGSFDLDVNGETKTILTDDSTIIDDNSALIDLAGFLVDVDVVDTDGVLFATEIEFDSAQNDAGDETEDEDTKEGSESEALEEINKAKREIQRADQKIVDAADKGKDTEQAVLKLNEAIALLLQAESSFEDGDFDTAEKLAEEAKDLAAESRMKYLGKEIEDFEDDKQSKSDKKLAKAQEKLDKKIAKEEAKRAEKLAKHEAKLLKAETRLAEKLSKLEEKLTEKAHLSEERANKILDKMIKETQKTDERVQKLIDKFQSGKYFGDNTNTDKEIKSFTLSFDGTAAEIGDQSNIETLSGEIFLENLLTGSHSKKFRVTGGSISIAEETGNAEVFDMIFGKARLSSSGQGGEKDSMILIAQTDDGADVKTLRLSIDLTEEFTEDTESAGIEILFPRSKIASLWFLSATGELKLTVDDPPAPSVTTSDGTTTDDTTPDDTTPLDDTPPADISQTIGLTISTELASYDTGDEIEISGTVDDIVDDLSVILQTIRGPELIDIAQIVPEADGSFSHTIQAEGPLWLVSDTVTIKAFYGGNNVAETNFEFLAE